MTLLGMTTMVIIGRLETTHGEHFAVVAAVEARAIDLMVLADWRHHQADFTACACPGILSHRWIGLEFQPTRQGRLSLRGPVNEVRHLL
jgi:hypothetical protein